MSTTCYAETPVYMHPAVLTMQVTSVRRPQIHPPATTSSDVRDLLEAAGSLSVRDIAAGLNVLESSVRTTVQRMLSRGEARMDEWDRVRAA